MSEAPQLDSVDNVALFLDFDGTLVHIVDRPDLTHVPPSLLATLSDAHAALDGALALVSGRSIADLDKLMEPLRLPAAGVHGLEYRVDGGAIRSATNQSVPEWAREELLQLAESAAGLLTEDKGHGMAIHYRLAPDREASVREAVLGIAARLGPDFILQDGKMVFELRPACGTKGTAVARFMERTPYSGRVPVFVGDDVTDEDAFRIVNEMGGVSIKVGRPDDASVARYELEDVSAVRNWLVPLTRRGDSSRSRTKQ
ncbi:MAG: trehalose-phosphatase [Gammaproteobacteria bacterium]|nr:trehalose-phosphatase [Gammaproteobacteria bacterium]MBT8445146.1 trehalose-phosphatase [Gammaproteobacteria bacterium]NND37272.1 trehalose-phosphatase [Gammaproteobacteria bacterium]